MGVQSSIIAGVPGLGLGLGIGGHGINGLGLGVNGLGLGVNSLGLVNGHGLGLGVNGLGLGVHGLGLGVNGLGLGVSGLGLAVPGHAWSQGAWLGAPAAVNVASHSLGGVAVAQQASLAGHGANYVAKTRGAIHSAPLAGHINSVASVNVAPAPGTW